MYYSHFKRCIKFYILNRKFLTRKSKLRKNIINNSKRMLFIFYAFVYHEIAIHEQVWSNPSPCTKIFLVKQLIISNETVNLLKSIKALEDFSLQYKRSLENFENFEHFGLTLMKVWFTVFFIMQSVSFIF